MYLLAPEILQDTRDLSPLISLGGLAVGGFLWALGGWGFRFWLVLVTTVAAGILGLYYGPDFGMQPLVAGLLLAVSAGALALSLVRLVLFLAVGFASLWLATVLAPGWKEGIACFLARGLVGGLLFRFWITVLTSFMGTLLVGYSLLSLVARFGWLDAVDFTTRQAPLLNWACAAATVLGVLVQLLLQRRPARAAEKPRSRKKVEAT